MFLKVCGITTSADAHRAGSLGATALGFVFWPRSPRHVDVERAAAIIAGLPATLIKVGVFVDEPVESIREVAIRTGITAVQLHGNEPPVLAAQLSAPLLRATTIADAPAAFAAWPEDTTFLLDTVDPVRRGGTGIPVDWNGAAELSSRRRVVLAGGLNPSNVADAIALVRPYGVDVSSGVESAPGVKDAEKLARFLANARSAFDRLHPSEVGGLG
jgi:phosphoribosylanthranilate isomerase